MTATRARGTAVGVMTEREVAAVMPRERRGRTVPLSFAAERALHTRVVRLAAAEHRTRSQMVGLLVAEALAARAAQDHQQ